MSLMLATVLSAVQFIIPAVPQEPAEERICRRGQETGTRIPTKTQCRTPADWIQYDQEMRKLSQRARNDLNRNGVPN